MKITDGLSQDQAKKVLEKKDIRLFIERLQGIEDLEPLECGTLFMWIYRYCKGEEVDMSAFDDRMTRLMANNVKSGIDMSITDYLNRAGINNSKNKTRANNFNAGMTNDEPQIRKDLFVN